MIAVLFVLAALALLPVRLAAQNPIAPPGLYLADPSARVWKDGRIYVYGSRDESPKYYCSWDHAVLSSSDLRAWEVAKEVFASKGPRDQVAYSDDLLYAPDCHYRNGVYYLFYCLASKANTEGVATSRSPTGPSTRPGPACFTGTSGSRPSPPTTRAWAAYATTTGPATSTSTSARASRASRSGWPRGRNLAGSSYPSTKCGPPPSRRST